MAEKGWITLDRKILEHWTYSDKPFNKSMAWIDLLLLADHTEHVSLWRGKPTIFHRGDVNISISQLAERWGWSRKKTRNFLKQLEGDNMVSLKVTTQRTTISLVKYGDFQTKGTTKVTTKGTTKVTPKVTTEGTHLKNNKRIIKENKESNLPTASDDDEGWMTPEEAYRVWKEQQKNE